MSAAPPPPADVLAAVTHPDPSAFYAALARRPLHRDAALGVWIAAGAADVEAVLTSDRCAVRPPAEPVPAVLRGSPAATVFGHLARMNDGGKHRAWKAAIGAALATLGPADAADTARREARSLWGEAGEAGREGRLTDAAFELPLRVLGDRLGFRGPETARLARLVRALAPALSPGGGRDDAERAGPAAGELLAWFADRPTDGTDDLWSVLAREARRLGRTERVEAAANAVGLLWQSAEATAGLLLNTWLALGRSADRGALAATPGALAGLVREVLCHDPPVQNTRRFVVRDGELCGRTVRAGDVVLVVLAAANLDPRRDGARGPFAFGAGPHACPGTAAAAAIAAAGIEAALAAGFDPADLPERVTYRPSPNARIPLLATRPVTGGPR